MTLGNPVQREGLGGTDELAPREVRDRSSDAANLRAIVRAARAGRARRRLVPRAGSACGARDAAAAPRKSRARRAGDGGQP